MRRAGTSPPRYPEIPRENFQPAVFLSAPPSSNSGRDDCAPNCTVQLPSRWPSARTAPFYRSGCGCNAGGPTSNRARGWPLQPASRRAAPGRGRSDRKRTREKRAASRSTFGPGPAKVLSVCSYRSRQVIEYTVSGADIPRRHLWSPDFLLHEHAIAVEIKSIARRNRVLVSLQNEFLASQGADQHEQSGLREMEVRQKRIDDAKAVPGINKRGRLASSWVYTGWLRTICFSAAVVGLDCVGLDCVGL